MTDNTQNSTNATPPQDINAPADSGISDRIDRLAGEPAPDITPEEFARLQKLGTLNLDSRGRVRPQREDDNDPGVSLRKRRAWYRSARS